MRYVHQAAPSGLCRVSTAHRKNIGPVPERPVRWYPAKIPLGHLLEQSADGVGGFGTAIQPSLHLFGVQLHFGGIGHGVVVTQEFQRTAITTGLVVGGHDAVERMLLAAQTGQFQLNSHDYLLFVLW